MTKEEMKRAVCQAIDEAARDIRDVAFKIESEPELGFKEVKTAEKVEKYLRGLGLTLETGLAITGIKTKVKGKKDGPTVAVIAELDAVGTPCLLYTSDAADDVIDV